jgi:hypothetical protein
MQPKSRRICKKGDTIAFTLKTLASTPARYCRIFASLLGSFALSGVEKGSSPARFKASNDLNEGGIRGA